MQPGEILNPGQSISSANGRYTFTFQEDGNLVLYRNKDGRPLWASGTYGKPGAVSFMQNGGNLVIYDPDMQAIWSTDTWHDPGSRLLVQDDGNLVIYRPDNTAVWATNTVDTKNVDTKNDCNGIDKAIKDNVRPVEAAYNCVKSLEEVFPIPTPTEQVEVGTFNAATGKFTGLVSVFQRTCFDGPISIKPKCFNVKLPPRVKANAVQLYLHFIVINDQGDSDVTVDGITYPVPVGFNSLIVNVKKSGGVSWKIRSGERSYSDSLSWERPPIIGVGAFINGVTK
jgi:hypothetical protein